MKNGGKDGLSLILRTGMHVSLHSRYPGNVPIGHVGPVCDDKTKDKAVRKLLSEAVRKLMSGTVRKLL